MAFLYKWDSVPETPLTSDGTQYGVIEVSDTHGFFTKQLIELKSLTLQPISLQVQEVISKTQLVVGPIGPKVGRQAYSNISAYLTSDTATISAPEQNKKNVPDKDHYDAIFMADPVVADRVIGVDEYGQVYGRNNPFPVTIKALVPKLYDDVILAYDINNNLINAQFYIAAVLIREIILIYDLNQNLIEAKKGSI